MRKILAGAAAAALLGAVAIVPSANAAGQDVFPDPANPNCHGQTIAYQATQLNITLPDGSEKNGNLAQIAKAFNGIYTVKYLQGLVDEFCAL